MLLQCEVLGLTRIVCGAMVAQDVDWTLDLDIQKMVVSISICCHLTGCLRVEGNKTGKRILHGLARVLKGDLPAIYHIPLRLLVYLKTLYVKIPWHM